MSAKISELPPVSISTAPTDSPVRIFQLDLNNITVELSSLGASITKILLPNYNEDDIRGNCDRDDVVLAYASPKEQFEDKNSVFFGAIVGRVANRIQGGTFQLHQIEQTSDGPMERLETYQLEKNNCPNHLHGGFDGFSNRNWTAVVVDDTVQFTLISPHGDQGYPGGVEVKAAYSLRERQHGHGSRGAQLHLSMCADLLPGETRATPISLAQHSYFNLASHSSPERILNHVLEMPNCHTFTPVDQTSIPTREVLPVGNETYDVVSAMDFREGKTMADALVKYGEEIGLDPLTAKCNVNRILNDATQRFEPGNVAIYGFDHNYVINQEKLSIESGLHVAAILHHNPTGRSLCVSTTAPGVQLYSSNYLNGMDPSLCKDCCSYSRWQGLCLETQTYPDSITLERRSCGGGEEFDNGKCFILRPGGETYSHKVMFEFSAMDKHL
ncbi:hypothetical protein HJC23_002962 [Cyclotella cryptica]|uniref:Aldose 1-epimerase n=1 Tax=Cyclotella cryptica TaxID=29204 RepID=A0ABD3PIZ2_9STRA|eukprot:CCRYP_015246-RA/>CCRYP_015246-RA protein AED:0.00 eAED:0.00 QI:319/-1/1/1/-1/1/1/44/441